MCGPDTRLTLGYNDTTYSHLSTSHLGPGEMVHLARPHNARLGWRDVYVRDVSILSAGERRGQLCDTTDQAVTVSLVEII